MRLLDAPLAIVDLETTGADPASDRITEMAVLTVEACGRVAEWSTLVNPGSPIPAPSRCSPASPTRWSPPRRASTTSPAELFERLQGRVFVAHNARFDYGFLRREFGPRRPQVQRQDAVHGAPVAPALPGRAAPQPRQPDRAPQHRLPRAPPRRRRRRRGVAVPAHRRARSTARKWSPSPRARSPSSPRCRRSSTARWSTRCRKRPGVYLLLRRRAARRSISARAHRCARRVMQHFAADRARHAAPSWRGACAASNGSAPPASSARCCCEARLVKELAPAFNRQLQAERRAVRLRLRRPRACASPARTRSTARRCPTSTACSAPSAPRCRPCAASPTTHGLCLQALGFETAGSRPGRARLLPPPDRQAAPASAPARRACTCTTARLAAALAPWKAAADWPHTRPARHRREGPQRAKRPKCTSSTAGATSAPRAPTRRSPSCSRAAAARASTSTTTASSRATSAGPACAPSASPRLMHCELVVPGLLVGADRSALSRRSSCCWRAAGATAPTRCRSSSGCTKPSSSPATALAAGALGLAASGAEAGDGWWARADPVHLRVLRDRVVVAPGRSVADFRRGSRPVARRAQSAFRRYRYVPRA